MKKLFCLLLLTIPTILFSQNTMTPELLWKLGRVTGLGVSKDKKYVVYAVSTPDWKTNRSDQKIYVVPLNGDSAIEIRNADSLLTNKNLSPDSSHLLSNKQVKVKKIFGS